MGTVIDGPGEFYSGRIPRKMRKKSIAEEVLADQSARKYLKRKYIQMQEESRKRGRDNARKFKRQKEHKSRK